MTDTTQTLAPAASRITIDDVRTALDGNDPNKTNAGKVRALLGNRGSFETIQKHLFTLRAELAAAAAPPVAADAVPALPADAANQMWLAAWAAAQVATMARAEKLASERDAALLKLETMGQDLAGLVATVDEQAGELELADAARQVTAAQYLDALQAKTDAVEFQAEQTAEALRSVERTRQELAKVQADAARVAQIAEAGRDVVRQEIGRLTDQIGELKAALYKRAESAPAV